MNFVSIKDQEPAVVPEKYVTLLALVNLLKVFAVVEFIIAITGAMIDHNFILFPIGIIILVFQWAMANLIEVVMDIERNTRR